MTSVSIDRWEDFEDQYRAEWERSYPNTPWNDVSYGYRYGWEMAQDPRYRDRDWSDVEHDLRTGWSEWEARHRTTSLGRQLQQGWEELKESVRHGWEKARRELNR
jgi:hypothetical protein